MDGPESVTIVRDRALRSDHRARVGLGVDGVATDRIRASAAGVSIDAVRRAEPDLDRFVAALLALAIHELDAERTEAEE
jgi:hypothetical protein